MKLTTRKLTAAQKEHILGGQRQALILFPESEDDEKLFADVVVLWSLILKIWHRDQIRRAVQSLQAAYRRGDVQYEDICLILASPDAKKQRAFVAAQGSQPLNEPHPLN
jgi:hypothetical protein